MKNSSKALELEYFEIVDNFEKLVNSHFSQLQTEKTIYENSQLGFRLNLSCQLTIRICSTLRILREWLSALVSLEEF